MAITQGNQATVTATLKVGGAVVNIPLSATVTAQLFSDNNVTSLGAPKALSSATIGSNWPHGVVVADFTALEMAAAVPPSVVVRIKMVDGAQERTWSVRVDVESADQSSGSALFPNKAATLAKVRRDRLVLLANSIMPDLQVSDDYLWDKLRAAEAHIAHALRVPLAPTRFFPRAPTPEQIAALPAGMPWDVDPAYDYDPANYTGDKWGMILTRQKPIQSIVGMKFVYPSPQQTIIDVPMDWVRHDPRYGQVQIVPTGTAYQTLLGGMFLSQFSGGRQLPFTVEMEYIAGLANAARDYPDLLDAVQKMAVVKIVEDGFMPQSGSISADGLSQSLSVDTSKYQESVDTILNGPAGSNGGLMARIHGVRMVVI